MLPKASSSESSDHADSSPPKKSLEPFAPIATTILTALVSSPALTKEAVVENDDICLRRGEKPAAGYEELL